MSNAIGQVSRKGQGMKAIQHGTCAGHHQEKRRGLHPCPKCRNAYNEYMRVYLRDYRQLRKEKKIAECREG